MRVSEKLCPLQKDYTLGSLAAAVPDNYSGRNKAHRDKSHEYDIHNGGGGIVYKPACEVGGVDDLGRDVDCRFAVLINPCKAVKDVENEGGIVYRALGKHLLVKGIASADVNNIGGGGLFSACLAVIGRAHEHNIKGALFGGLR